MSAKIWVTVAILGGDAIYSAVVEDCPQLVEAVARNVWMCIHDDTGYLLTSVFCHDPRLSRVERIAFVVNDDGHRRDQRIGLFREGRVAGK